MGTLLLRISHLANSKYDGKLEVGPIGSIEAQNYFFQRECCVDAFGNLCAR